MRVVKFIFESIIIKIVSLFEASNYPISVYLIIIKWTHEECEIEIRYFIYRFISVIDKID